MGRKKSPSNVRKKNTISTYLNDQDNEKFNKKALESNLSTSEYLRTLIISQF